MSEGNSITTARSDAIVFYESVIVFRILLVVSLAIFGLFLLGSYWLNDDLSGETIGLLAVLFVAVPVSLYAFRKRRRVEVFPNRCVVYAGRMQDRLVSEFYWNAVSKAWFKSEDGGQESGLTLFVNVNGNEIKLMRREYRGDPVFIGLVDAVVTKIDAPANYLRCD